FPAPAAADNKRQASAAWRRGGDPLAADPLDAPQRLGQGCASEPDRHVANADGCQRADVGHHLRARAGKQSTAAAVLGRLGAPGKRILYQQGDAEFGRIAALFLTLPPNLGNGCGKSLRGIERPPLVVVAGVPGIGKPDRPATRGGAFAADPDRWVRPLYRLGVEQMRIKTHVLAAIAGPLLRPQRAKGLQIFVG